MINRYLYFVESVLILVCVTSITAQADMEAKAEVVVKGRYGSADGEFGLKKYEDQSWAEPTGIAIDSKGNIYIADPLNNRIQKFDKSGQFLIKISLEIKKSQQRFAMTVDDLAVDQKDNLYAVSRHEQKIVKYTPNGRIIQTIRFRELDIAWLERRGWRSGGYFQAERIAVDIVGNIYMKGFRELIKLSKDGKLKNKWRLEGGSYFIDHMGHLYISQELGRWDKYDQEGKLLGVVECEKEYLMAFNLAESGRCQFPPKFIDKNGFRYYFEFNQKTNGLESILKVDRDGSFVRYKAPHIDVWQPQNMTKFDVDGNLYGYGVDNATQEYWILKVRMP